MSKGLLHAFASDVGTSSTRYAYIAWLVRNIPGQIGISVRAGVLRPFFGAAGPGLMLHSGVHILGVNRLFVGRDFRVAYNCVIEASGGIEIGNQTIFGPGVQVWSVNDTPGRADSEGGVGEEHRKVVIGSRVWIGANSYVMPGARIGDDVVISAGSVVGEKPIESLSIVAGNPARRIGTRQDRQSMPPAAAAP